MSPAIPLALGSYATPLLAPAWTEFGIALIVVVGRVYSSCVITRLVRSDLYLSVVTFVCYEEALMRRLCERGGQC